MISKTLFLVLVGCALVLASPIKREDSKEVDVPKQSQDIEVKEIDEEEWNEIFEDIQEKINDIFTEIHEDMNDEDFTKALDDVKKIVDKLFKK